MHIYFLRKILLCCHDCSIEIYSINANFDNRLAASDDVWIGLRYMDVDKWFRWDDDTNVIWEYFDMYDPDMGTVPALEQCTVTMKINGYRWHVVNCKLDQRYFVCESGEYVLSGFIVSPNIFSLKYNVLSKKAKHVSHLYKS